MLLARKGEQLAGQRRTFLGRAADDRQHFDSIFAQRLFGHQQLRIAPDRHQQVIEIMGHAAGKRAQCAHLQALLLQGLHALALGQVAHHVDPVAISAFPAQRRCRRFEDAPVMGRELGRCHRGVNGCRWQQVAQLAPDQYRLCLAQQIHQRGVVALNCPAFIGHGHAVAKRLERQIGQAAFAQQALATHLDLFDQQFDFVALVLSWSIQMQAGHRLRIAHRVRQLFNGLDHHAPNKNGREHRRQHDQGQQRQGRHQRTGHQAGHRVR